MKALKFSDQHITLILKQLFDGLGFEEVCRKAFFSLQTYYRWRKKYGGLKPSEVRRLKQLEEENGRFGRPPRGDPVAMLVHRRPWRYRWRGRRSWPGLRSRPLQDLRGWRLVAQG